MIRKINEISYLDNCETVPIVRFYPFDKYKWLNCGFSTRIGGVSTGYLDSLNLGFERNDKRSNVIENFRRFGESAGFDPYLTCLPSQWHTNNIRVAGPSHCCGPDFEKKTDDPVDGQITDSEKVVLLSYGADCVPVFIADPVRKAVGLCHSGWKGTINGITKDAIKMMSEEYKTDPADLVAVIGPSIGPDRYEVGIDVGGQFIDRFRIQVTDRSGIVRTGSRKDKYWLDLWAANRENLTEAGLMPENIYISGICTYTESELMYSHRRMGNERGVMAGFMKINS